MILCEDSLGGFFPVADIEPARGLGNEQAEYDNETGAKSLEPSDESPRVVTPGVETGSGGSGGDDGPGEPKGIVQSYDFQTSVRTWDASKEI